MRFDRRTARSRRRRPDGTCHREVRPRRPARCPYPIDLYFAPWPQHPCRRHAQPSQQCPGARCACRLARSIRRTAGPRRGASTPASRCRSIAASIGASPVQDHRAVGRPDQPRRRRPIRRTCRRARPARSRASCTTARTSPPTFRPDVDSGGKFLRITPLKPFDFSSGPAANTSGPSRQGPQRRLPRRPDRRPQGDRRPGHAVRHVLRRDQGRAGRLQHASPTRRQRRSAG